ncbi:MAG TPA: hypothetical protein VIK96_00155 [Bacilli bacterium]
MELRICCDASVKLEQMRNVNEIHCRIDNYKIKGDMLEGNIRISGNYMKDDMNNTYDFNELVPFTIVFKDKNFQVENIEVQDFECQEIVNQGIECQFNIVVVYNPKKAEAALDLPEAEGENVEEEINVKTDADQNFKAEVVVEEEMSEMEKDAEVPFVEETPSIPVDKDVEEEEIMKSDEAIKAEINQKYNELLTEILEARADENFYETETKKAVTVSSEESRDDCRGFLRSLKSDYKSVKVYYTVKEADIEQICKNERVSVDKVYRDNQKSDFINKRRIIIK